ncbi:MAG: hypothetical protein AMXMBFR13_20560 [Phycisphaerae bacterium]
MQAQSWLYELRSNFWFVPSVMLAVSIGLAFGLLEIDQHIKPKMIDDVAWIYSGTPDGAREVLGTIAGSMITVAGLVFSITMVVLTLASQQFGPRLLITFMRDRGNQIVLGTFVSTFIYCLLVLRAVRSGEDDLEFVPYISVTAALVLALTSLGVLIFFIHHVSQLIQAPNVIAAVSADLDAAIDEIFPEKLGEDEAAVVSDSGEKDVPEHFERDAQSVVAEDSGYLRAVDRDEILQLATQRDLIIQLHYRPGHFIIGGSLLARVWPGARLDEEVSRKINEALVLGPQRTLEQDVEFAIDQLVEVAVRALSTGINDPFTAMNCTDRLGAALVRIGERRMPSPYRYDNHGKLRVIADAVTIRSVVDAAFNQIRQHGRDDVAVMIRLLETITIVGERVRHAQLREALLRQAHLIADAGREAIPDQADRQALESRLHGALRTLAELSHGRASTQLSNAQHSHPASD